MSNFKKKRVVNIEEYNEIVKGSNVENPSTCTTSSNNPSNFTYDNLKDAMAMLKDIDPLRRMSMSHKTWGDMPKAEEKSDIFPDFHFPMGIPVDTSDIIPDDFIRNEYESGKVSLLNLLTGKEETIIEGK